MLLIENTLNDQILNSVGAPSLLFGIYSIILVSVKWITYDAKVIYPGLVWITL